MGNAVYMHPLTERIWHWVHALLVLGLTVTGIHLHWPEACPIFGGLDRAVFLHDLLGWLLVLDFLVWLVFNLSTNGIKQYLPSASDLTRGALGQARYYAWGIFRHEPHPHHATPDRKFNPLQKISYAGLMFLLLPLLVVTGLLFMFPVQVHGVLDLVGGLAAVAILHTVLAFVVVAFTVVHAYLTTTGPTVLADVRSMVTGWLEEEPGAHP